MIAVDTNIIVRLLTVDDEQQAEDARKLFVSRKTYIMMNVAMETEWVLRTSYKFSRAQLADAFARLFGLPNVVLDRPDLMRKALAGLRAGLDFADALHLLQASDRGVPQFATFDKSLRKRAKRLGVEIEVVAP